MGNGLKNMGACGQVDGALDSISKGLEFPWLMCRGVRQISHSMLPLQWALGGMKNAKL